jgi:hypothetical protein
LQNVLAQPPTLQSVPFRGAFDTLDGWADGWTALSRLGYMPIATPVLVIAPAGGTVNLTWNSVPGLTYQLESKSPITGSWTNDGPAVVAGDDSTTVNRSAAEAEKYYRILRQ